MLLQRAQGLMFILIGALSLADGWRITLQARDAANFDAIGPDRYLMALGTVLLGGGVWSLLGRQHSALEPGAGFEATPAGTASALVLTLAALAGFAALTPLIGFSLACFLFLAFELGLLASWPWWKSIVIAAIIAAAFHVTFIGFADMPMPKGVVWI
jgi:hypothetical protein